MLTAFLRAFRTPDLRRKLLFTIFIIAVFRLGAALPTPGISEKAVHSCTGLATKSGSGVVALVNLFSGGALFKLSVFALGIMPYITASIILRLLTVVSPHLEKLKKEGDLGRKKMTDYTRWMTVGLSAFQALAIAVALEKQTSAGMPLVNNPGPGFVFSTVLALTAGARFIMWLGETIPPRGIGNGELSLTF